jgi:hypothetical protein
MKAFLGSIVLAVAFLLSLTASFGQGATPTVIRWSYGAPNAVTDITHAAKVEGLKAGDVHIYVALYDMKDTEYNRAWIQVVNHGNAPINFNPQLAFLLRGDQTVRAEEPEKAANSVQGFGYAKSQQLAAPTCNTMNGGGGGAKGGASGVSASLACQPTNMQLELSKEVLNVSNEWVTFIHSRALKPTTVAPGEQAVGAVIFRKGKRPTDYMLAVPIGNKTFEFPVSALNQSPSYD